MIDSVKGIRQALACKSSELRTQLAEAELVEAQAVGGDEAMLDDAIEASVRLDMALKDWEKMSADFERMLECIKHNMPNKTPTIDTWNFWFEEA